MVAREVEALEVVAGEVVAGEVEGLEVVTRSARGGRPCGIPRGGGPRGSGSLRWSPGRPGRSPVWDALEVEGLEVVGLEVVGSRTRTVTLYRSHCVVSRYDEILTSFPCDSGGRPDRS